MVCNWNRLKSGMELIRLGVCGLCECWNAYRIAVLLMAFLMVFADGS